MHPWIEALVALFLLLGSLFALIGAIGLYRLPDFMMGPMANPFYADLGLAKEMVGAVRSGPGLVALHDALRALDGAPAVPVSAEEVSTRAQAAACPYCMEALSMFCALLGTVAGDLALTLGARGGIYIGGGVVPRLGEFFAHSAFRTRFEAKGRFQPYLAQIPTWVIRSPHAALLGASAALDVGFEIGYTACAKLP